MRGLLLLGVVAMLALTGCTPGIRGAAASVSPLKTGSYQVVAAGAEKTHCVIRLFYLGEPPALVDAVNYLVAEKGGDAAINVQYEQYVDTTSVILQIFTGSIVTNTCVKVKADIIKYQ